jgi:uncharacterized protein YndB with AHSA1/START domain
MLVVDEAIIDASPERVFRALIEECNGKTHWWMPHLETKPMEGKQFGEEGSTMEMTVHRFGTPRLGVRLTGGVEGEAMTWEIFEGGSLGTAEWTFEPVAPGKTKVTLRWDVVLKRPLFRMFGPRILGRVHSGVVHAGFDGMNRYLSGLGMTNHAVNPMVMATRTKGTPTGDGGSE